VESRLPVKTAASFEKAVKPGSWFHCMGTYPQVDRVLLSCHTIAHHHASVQITDGLGYPQSRRTPGRNIQGCISNCGCTASSRTAVYPLPNRGDAECHLSTIREDYQVFSGGDKALQEGTSSKVIQRCRQAVFSKLQASHRRYLAMLKTC
jgi:hypothetical protein